MEVTTSGCSLLLLARSIAGVVLDCTLNRGAVNTRRDGPPHCGHGIDAGAVPIDACSCIRPCSVQPYSYATMCGPLIDACCLPSSFGMNDPQATDRGRGEATAAVACGGHRPLIAWKQGEREAAHSPDKHQKCPAFSAFGATRRLSHGSLHPGR